MNRQSSFKRHCYGIGMCVALALIAGCQQRQAETRKEQTPEAIPVQVVRVSLRDLQETLDYAANIKAQEEVMVYPKVSGKIVEKTKEEGAPVAKGDPIVTIDRDETGLRFEKAPVESPITGIVGRVYVDIGSQVDTRTAIALVVAMDKVKTDFEIPEKYLPKVSAGDKARVSVDAYRGEVFHGVVSQVSPVIDPLTRTAPLEIVIDNQDHRLKSGMFARVSLILAELSKVPVVLKEAIQGAEPNLYVYAVENNKAAIKKIKLGLRSGDYFQVAEGLKENDLVVVMGQQRLHEGAAVTYEENNR
ncbi:MAG: efflux RND transporter periplasmic adaptor subunit [Candidatus Omnitrophica bacterium]|nr:efflux RND transporter periplasmic adaptor subunit [Candidatus Omnitrophota bacterium]